MTQANEPSGQDNLNRTLRTINRRLNRLEESQVTGRELDEDFDRVFLEIDGLALGVRQMKAELKGDIQRLSTDIGELNRKFDLVMKSHYWQSRWLDRNHHQSIQKLVIKNG
jgi:hypothetical protein